MIKLKSFLILIGSAGLLLLSPITQMVMAACSPPCLAGQWCDESVSPSVCRKVVGEIGCTPGYPCASTNSFGELLQTGISVVMVLALVVMIGFLVKGAYTYITSGANAKARADGLNTIKWAVIGILVLAAALVFYQLIQLVIGRSLIDIY